jgi:intracellular multiplication protein IcmL
MAISIIIGFFLTARVKSWPQHAEHYTFLSVCYIVQKSRGEVKMAGEQLQVTRLRDDFYRDGFYKVVVALVAIVIAIFSLIALSVYIYLDKPPPVTFATDNEWRILPPVPLEQQYLTTPDLIQWVSETLPAVFTYDFVNYTKQAKDVAQYFTTNGWGIFLDKINQYANYTNVVNSKLFINAHPAGAPFILNQGLIGDHYAWWVQMPINLDYITVGQSSTQPLIIQVLVVRVSTLNNLSGVGIDNIIVRKGGGDQVRFNDQKT